jgi:hypothetical protein
LLLQVPPPPSTGRPESASCLTARLPPIGLWREVTGEAAPGERWRLRRLGLLLLNWRPRPGRGGTAPFHRRTSLLSICRKECRYKSCLQSKLAPQKLLNNPSNGVLPAHHTEYSGSGGCWLKHHGCANHPWANINRLVSV